MEDLTRLEVQAGAHGSTPSAVIFDSVVVRDLDPTR
jgi:hypothetical protein